MRKEAILKYSRRDFVKASSASLIVGSSALHAARIGAKTLKLPLALQLYSVRGLLPKDYAGTLKEIGALGYKEVESAGYFNHTAAEVKKAMDDAGLKLVGAHHPSDDLHRNLDQILSFSHEVGITYIICSSPGHKNPNPADKGQFTLDDWRWNADQFNMLGEKVSAAGMKFGYHNHILEFKETNGTVIPYLELLRLTDPSKVTMELDCGWVTVGGGNPIEYLRNYPTRITMLHVKDFKRSLTPPSNTNRPSIAELGQGIIDYGPIFEEAAKAGNIKHCFAEQEAFNAPWIQSLKIDADYLQKLGMS